MRERKTIDAADLIRAAEEGAREAVAALLAAGADVNAHTPGGETALMRAAARGHAGVVRLLLERGADPNLRRHDHWTALMLAAFFDHTDAVCELVAGGADALLSDRNGTTALAWASSRGNIEAARFLKDAVTVAQGRERTHGRAPAQKSFVAEAAAREPSQKADAERSAPATSREVFTDTRAEASPVKQVEASSIAQAELSALLKSSQAGSATTKRHERAPVSNSTHVHAAVPTPLFEMTPSPAAAPQAAIAAQIPPAQRRGSRLNRLALYAAPLLLILCGALAYKLFLLSNEDARSKGVEARPEAQQPAPSAQTQAQPAMPVAGAPSGEEAVETAAPGVVNPIADGQSPASVQTDVPDYVPAETTPARISIPTHQPPGRPAGGEPSIISLGQPDPAKDAERALGESARPAGERPAARSSSSSSSSGGDEPRDPPRPARQESAVKDGASDNTPRPSATPKPKVIPWP